MLARGRVRVLRIVGRVGLVGRMGVLGPVLRIGGSLGALGSMGELRLPLLTTPLLLLLLLLLGAAMAPALATGLSLRCLMQEQRHPIEELAPI